MLSKSMFKSMRDALQQGIYAVINPFVRFLIRIGVTPNVVTTIGFLGNFAAATLFTIVGYDAAETGEIHWPLVTIAGGVIILFSLFDMLDGQVARLGNMVSRFGAMYDSVLDRYCELLTLGGIAYFLFGAGCQWGAIITFLALIGSVMVSYVRARAEGLGIECKIGFMQRPERVVVTALASLASGISCSLLVLAIAMGVIALFANLTAFARLSHCRKALENGKR